MDLNEILKQAKGIFKFEGIARHNLVLSHQRRMKLNREIAIQIKPPGAIMIRCKSHKGQTMQSQTMWIWEGCELLGAGTHKVKNGIMYKLEAIEDEHVLFTTGERLTFQEVARDLRMSFAQTYMSCQGSEFHDSLKLWDCDSKFFTLKHLYVGMSRSRDSAKVAIQ